MPPLNYTVSIIQSSGNFNGQVKLKVMRLLELVECVTNAPLLILNRTVRCHAPYPAGWELISFPTRETLSQRVFRGLDILSANLVDSRGAIAFLPDGSESSPYLRVALPPVG